MKHIPKGFRAYDTADHLKSEADIAAYLDACNELEDPVLIIDALSLVARARNHTAVAAERHPIPIAREADGSVTPYLSNAQLYAIMEAEDVTRYQRVLTEISGTAPKL
jgi:probable addiction module antidote protein